MAKSTTGKSTTSKTKTTRTRAKSARTSRATKTAPPKSPDGEHPMYDPAASRSAYSKGDVVYFPKVRNWMDKGEMVDVLGTVVNTGVFDNEVPYIEVNFHAQKKVNKIDLGKDIRRFILEVK